MISKQLLEVYFLDKGVLPELQNGAATVPKGPQVRHSGSGPQGWAGSDEAVSLETRGGKDLLFLFFPFCFF